MSSYPQVGDVCVNLCLYFVLLSYRISSGDGASNPSKSYRSCCGESDLTSYCQTSTCMSHLCFHKQLAPDRGASCCLYDASFYHLTHTFYSYLAVNAMNGGCCVVCFRMVRLFTLIGCQPRTRNRAKYRVRVGLGLKCVFLFLFCV